MMRIVLHHLLVIGSGLSLGPDCDGILNLMDAELPSLSAEPAPAPKPAEVQPFRRTYVRLSYTARLDTGVVREDHRAYVSAFFKSNSKDEV